ncbi:MAG: trypsin-like peptidase domain-containing protein [Candidatus Kapaibacterium sp.]
MKYFQTTLLLVLLCTGTVFSQQDASDMIERVLPSTVTVTVKERVNASIPFGFAGVGESDNPETVERTKLYEAAYTLGYKFDVIGSGFAVEINGKKYIITNAHVAEAILDKEIECIGADNTTYKMKLLGADRFYDIAVLEFLDNTAIKPLTFRTKPLRIGQTVFAIGAPSGYSNTVTQGTVSGLNRLTTNSVATDRGMGGYGFVQHTAGIYHGNSGGALLDAQGNICGINSQGHYDGRDGVIASINFAINTDVVQKVVNDIVISPDHRYQRMYSGIAVSAISDVYSDSRFVVITGVHNNSPAGEYKERLKNTLLLSINSSDVHNLLECTIAFEKVAPGKPITLVVINSNRKRDTVTITTTTLTETALEQVADLALANDTTVAIKKNQDILTMVVNEMEEGKSLYTTAGSGKKNKTEQPKKSVATKVEYTVKGMGYYDSYDGDIVGTPYIVKNKADIGKTFRIMANVWNQDRYGRDVPVYMGFFKPKSIASYDSPVFYTYKINFPTIYY